jgi:hypothetical protein
MWPSRGVSELRPNVATEREQPLTLNVGGYSGQHAENKSPFRFRSRCHQSVTYLKSRITITKKYAGTTYILNNVKGMPFFFMLFDNRSPGSVLPSPTGTMTAKPPIDITRT